MSKISEYWKRLPPEWRFAIGAFVIARLALTLWSLAVYSILPVALQNLDLFGKPIVTVFNLRTSEHHVYSRQVDNTVLSFRVIDTERMTDDQTGTIWSLRDGQAVQGDYVGKSLMESSRTSEDIFPYLGMSPAKNILLSLWQRFDTNWYLRIAVFGYQGWAGSTAYFPLYPILIRVLSFVMEPMFAAVLLSNLALIGVIVVLYRLVSTLTDEQTTRRALIYFLVFPTSFFLEAAYTESLFLLFTIGSLYVASRQHWVWAVILGMFAALTRLQGALLVVPLIYMLWREYKYSLTAKLFFRVLPLAIIPLGTLVFFWLSNFSTFNALQGTWHARFVFPWNNVWASISLLMSSDSSIIDAMNLSVTLGFIIMMFSVWKKLPLEYSLYSLFMLLIPLFRMNTTQPLVSMTRYALVIFPVFIVLGIWGRNQWVNRVVIYTSVLLQLYLSAQFILWGWVA